MDNRLQLNGSLNARRVNETWGNDGMFDTALSMNPTMPLYADNGNYYQPTSPTGARNPVAELVDIDNNGQRMYVLGTAEAKLNLLRTDKQLLNTSLSYSLHYNDLKQHYFTLPLQENLTSMAIRDVLKLLIKNGILNVWNG